MLEQQLKPTQNINELVELEYNYNKLVSYFEDPNIPIIVETEHTITDTNGVEAPKYLIITSNDGWDFFEHYHLDSMEMPSIIRDALLDTLSSLLDHLGSQLTITENYGLDRNKSYKVNGVDFYINHKGYIEHRANYEKLKEAALELNVSLEDHNLYEGYEEFEEEYEILYESENSQQLEPLEESPRNPDRFRY